MGVDGLRNDHLQTAKNLLFVADQASNRGQPFDRRREAKASVRLTGGFALA